MVNDVLLVQLQQRLRDYLAIAEGHAPDETALDVRSVAAALGVSTNMGSTTT
jgi:hypothetical protein